VDGVTSEQPSVEALVSELRWALETLGPLDIKGWHNDAPAALDSLTAEIERLKGLLYVEQHGKHAEKWNELTAALEARRWNDSLFRDALRELRDPNGLSREDIAGSLERDMKNV
jgi:hypothetical protein